MAVADTSKAAFAGKRFLIVDDFDGMRNILRELLRRCGGEQIDLVATGADAITTLARHHYDVVLCDYHLGAGKNGQQVLEEARTRNLISPATIWAMITAEKTSDMVMGAAEHQPDDYLIKPLTEAMLQTRLTRMASRKIILSAIEAAVRAKDYLKAIELCDQRLNKEQASDAHVQRLRCEMLVQTGNIAEAKASFERQLAMREAPWAMVGLAKLYFRAGQYGRAKALLERALEGNQGFLEGCDWMARTLIQLGEWQPAQEVLKRASTLSPHSVNRQQTLGDVSVKCKDYDTAELAYRKAVKLGADAEQKSPKPYLGLARVYTEKGSTREALAVLTQLTEDIQGEGIKLQAKAAEIRIHHKSGNAALARQCAEELLAKVHSGNHDLPPSGTLEMAETLMQLGNKEVGSQLIQFVVRNHYEHESLLSRAQSIFDRIHMAEEGAGIVAAARRVAMETMDKGVRLATQGKQNEGIAVMREALTLMPSNPRLRLNLAYLLIAQMEKNGWHHDSFQEARRALDTAKMSNTDQERCGQLQARLEKLARN